MDSRIVTEPFWLPHHPRPRTADAVSLTTSTPVFPSAREQSLLGHEGSKQRFRIVGGPATFSGCTLPWGESQELQYGRATAPDAAP